MKLVTVVGARPQFVKAAVVSRVARKQGVEEILVHTGQHYDANMSDVFFEEMEIPRPDFHLGIGSGGHGQQTGRMLEGIEKILVEVKPDWLLVYGDTNSTIAGALAAAKLHVPVAHVEAGLRSFNRRMPEEINRVLTDHCSELLFAPTSVAVENLRREGVAQEKIRQVGDVMLDAAVFYGRRAEQSSDLLRRLGLEKDGFVLATIHRAENTDDPKRLRAIVEGFNAVARELPLVLPLHPRTRKILANLAGVVELSPGLRVIDPVGYLEMVVLEKNARLIATDSGGVQKEAYFHGTPCVTLRDETEWVELLEAGANRLLPPTDGPTVAAGLHDALKTMPRRADRGQLYGDGQAGEQIVQELTGV